jgi:hypothetical protein
LRLLAGIVAFTGHLLALAFIVIEPFSMSVEC